MLQKCLSVFGKSGRAYDLISSTADLCDRNLNDLIHFSVFCVLQRVCGIFILRK